LFPSVFQWPVCQREVPGEIAAEEAAGDWAPRRRGGAVGGGVAAAVGAVAAPAALQAAISADRAVSPAAPASPVFIRSRLEIGSLSPRSPIALSCLASV